MEKDGKDEKEGKEKDEQKAGVTDRSRISKSGSLSCFVNINGIPYYRCCSHGQLTADKDIPTK